MKVALTGTPGTGKTSVAQLLVNRGYTVESFDRLAADHVVGYDPKRECDVVDVDSINATFRPADDIIIEGHLSHLLNMDGAIVLRCHPKVLQMRLRHKGWPDPKVQENVAAEGLDIILTEAKERYGDRNVAEIDTTTRSAQQTAEILIDVIESDFKREIRDEVDWMGWVIDHVGQV
jgi:adenylate kinase